MKNLIIEIKRLSKKLYNAEVSAKDEEVFESLGYQAVKEIRNVLREAVTEEQLILVKQLLNLTLTLNGNSCNENINPIAR